MYEFNELTYAAIITINMPSTGEPVRVYVTLTPPDKVDLNIVKTVKPLKDCTLAELQQFAAELEADVWNQHDKITLYDLAESEDTTIEIAVINDKNEALAPAKEWLAKGGIVFPQEKAAAAETKDISLEEIFAGELPPASPAFTEAVDEDLVETAELEVPAELNELEALEEMAWREAEPAVPTQAEIIDEIEVGITEEEPEPEITVLDSEPVYEEREAPLPGQTVDEPAPTAESVGLAKPKGRTAGERLPLNHPTPHACDVLIDEYAFRGAQAHSLTSMTREVAGVLVGPHPEKQPDGRYVVHITDYIVAKHTRMQGASVTYTPESWRYVSDVMMARYPEEEAVIVGWYHTHPGFGIFLSNMDLFIHHNFFTQKWHLALVLDPVGKRSGFFSWDRQQKEVLAYPFPWPYWAHRSW